MPDTLGLGALIGGEKESLLVLGGADAGATNEGAAAGTGGSDPSSRSPLSTMLLRRTRRQGGGEEARRQLGRERRVDSSRAKKEAVEAALSWLLETKDTKDGYAVEPVERRAAARLPPEQKRGTKPPRTRRTAG